MEGRGRAGEQAAAADGHERGVEAGHLIEELEAHGPLPGDHRGILERMDRERAGALGIVGAEYDLAHGEARVLRVLGDVGVTA